MVVWSIKLYMEKPSCSQLRTQLQEIKEFKAEFDLELPKVKDTRDTAPALKLEEEIMGRIKSIRALAPVVFAERTEITIGDKSKEDLIKELEERAKSNNPEDKIYIPRLASSMLQNPDFLVVSQPEKIKIIRLKVRDLGLGEWPTTNQIYKRAEELGLELCTPEIGPYLRLHYQEVFKREQAKGESLYIGMKHIADSDGNQSIFDVHLNHFGDNFLHKFSATPEYKWLLDSEIIFTRK